MENPWSNLGDACIHPDDEEALEMKANKLVGDFEVQRDLLPFPFFGCPNQVKVFILTSNPGYVSINRQEQNDILFREAFKKSLQHSTPHPYLDPQFHPEKHLDISEKLMCVQLFPYHSKSFYQPIAQNLPTQEYALRLVMNAIDKEKEIVILRDPWRDLLKKKLHPKPLEHFPFITVVRFQGRRTPSLSKLWMKPEKFDHIIKSLKDS